MFPQTSCTKPKVVQTLLRKIVSVSANNLTMLSNQQMKILSNSITFPTRGSQIIIIVRLIFARQLGRTAAVSNSELARCVFRQAEY